MMNEKEKKKEILFFNTPISENVQDIIGVKTYVQKISCAIDAGAQMIAITAPFGAGKTSVIELLVKERGIKNEEDIVNKAENNEGIYTKNNRDRKQKLNYKRKTLKRNKIKEKIYKISMWSQLNECENEIKSNDLHRTFIYQLLSQINHKRGTYIRRRLNPNYKILKLHVNKTRYWIVFVLALICLSLFWVINSFGEYLKGILPFLVDFQSTLEIFLLLFGVVLSIVSITTAEIIFSAIKQNSDKREIESTEIIDIYREEILKYASKIDLFNLTNRKIIVGIIGYMLMRRRLCIERIMEVLRLIFFVFVFVIVVAINNIYIWAVNNYYTLISVFKMALVSIALSAVLCVLTSLIVRLNIYPGKAKVKYYDRRLDKNVYLYFRFNDEFFVAGEEEKIDACESYYFVRVDEVIGERLDKVSYQKMTYSKVYNDNITLQIENKPDISLNDIINKFITFLQDNKVDEEEYKGTKIYIKPKDGMIYFDLPGEKISKDKQKVGIYD